MATTTTERKKLTPKQRQVYDALYQGRTVHQIAKRLKITPSGVYGHMRQIRKAGVSLADMGMPPEPEANEAHSDAPGEPATTTTNGDRPGQEDEVQAYIANAVEQAQVKAEEHKERVERFAAQMREAEVQHAGALARLDKLQAARAALN